MGPSHVKQLKEISRIRQPSTRKKTDFCAVLSCICFSFSWKHRSSFLIPFCVAPIPSDSLCVHVYIFSRNRFRSKLFLTLSLGALPPSGPPSDSLPDPWFPPTFFESVRMLVGKINLPDWAFFSPYTSPLAPQSNWMEQSLVHMELVQKRKSVLFQLQQTPEVMTQSFGHPFSWLKQTEKEKRHHQ